MRSCWVCGALLVSSCASLQAQALLPAPPRPEHAALYGITTLAPRPTTALATAARPQEEGSRPAPSVADPIAGGLLGGAAGLALGYVLVASGGCYETDRIGPIMLALLVESAGMAIGTHLGNRKRGNVGLDVLVSGLTLAVALSAGSAGTDAGAILALGLQLAAVVGTERVTTSGAPLN